VRRLAPGLGEHTAEVLTELGVDAQARDALFAEGVVEGEAPD
jgi:crotonobetainyl-CoA:carnitine CoA-transferase CaiB-like acyl-CoA transferase